MARIVQKYGGTSVGSIERIKEVAGRIAARRSEGNELLVAVSAMAGETDRLISLAEEVSPLYPDREYDMLLASGEQVSIALLSMALNAMGVPARSFLSFQLPIVTDERHSLALIREVGTERILRSLERGEVAVVAGFQGVTPVGEITTLGRGGSDTTAVALAAALKADFCEIYTDVSGVYTCDPQVYAAARKLARVSYEEMMEMAGLGARVLHPRCVELARKYGVNILVRSSFNNEGGTWVSEEDEGMEGALISGVTYTKGEAKVSIMGVPDRPGIAARIFNALSDKGINVDMIIQNVSRDNMTDVTFTVPQADLNRVVLLMERVAQEIGAEGVLSNSDIAKVSAVGAGMKSHPGVAARMFSALAGEGINIMMISTSEIKVSCVIDSRYTELAVRVLHDAFGLERGSS